MSAATPLREEAPPADRAPSVELLIAVAHELSELGRTGVMLQDLIGGKVRAGALSGMALLDAQAADLLVQHLTELAKFLKTYAEGLQGDAPDPLASALDTVLLSALSRRLGRDKAEEADEQAAGDLEMF